MDSKKLEYLRARYAGATAGESHDPEFRKVVDKVFAGTDRRPKPYEGVSTLLGAPLRPEVLQQADLGGLDVALIGVPMDLGVTNRTGARFGPRAVRAVERIGPYHHVHRIAPLAEIKVADVGDVPFTSRFSLETSHQDIETFYTKVVAAGVVPLSVGGDHSISQPILKAVGARQPVGMVHIDAHCDTSGPFEGSKFHHGGPFRQAVLAGVLDPERTIQIGIRGGAEFLWEFSYDSGMTVIHAEQFAASRRSRNHREDTPRDRQRPDLRLLRRRQPRSGIRAGHGNARGWRLEHARGDGACPRLCRPRHRRWRRGRGRSSVRRDHQHGAGRRANAVRDPVADRAGAPRPPLRLDGGRS